MSSSPEGMGDKIWTGLLDVFVNENPLGVSFSCKDLCRIGYGKGGAKLTLLSNVSVDFPSGQLTAIIGPSGCGKSTLLKALCGVEKADSGLVMIDKHNYYEDMDLCSSLISYLPQFDDLNEELSVLDELRATAFLRSDSSSEQARLSKISDYLELFGIEKKVHSRIASLSGGEKKRVAIIAALLADPRILFLDEPTAPLDPGTSDDFINQLKQIAREEKVTVVVVTHDPDALLCADRVVLLASGGKLVFRGSRESFFRDLKAHYGGDNNESYLVKQLFKTFSSEANLPQFPSCAKFHPNPTGLLDHLRIEKRGFLSQFKVLIVREFKILTGGGSSSLIMMSLPLIIGSLLGLVVNRDEMYSDYALTKSMMFAVSAGAFFMGVFSSINKFSAKSRIKNDQLHGVNTGAYLLAVFVSLVVVCLLQSCLLYVMFTSLAGSPPKVLYAATYDILTTIVICSVSAMSLGLLCSSLFRNPTYVAPILVLLQLIFSGIIFQLGDNGFAKELSNFISCRWAMDAFGAICDLNELPYYAPSNNGIVSLLHAEDQYEHDTYRLFSCWFFLVLLSLLTYIATLLVLLGKRRLIFHPNFLCTRSLISFWALIKRLCVRFKGPIIAVFFGTIVIYVAIQLVFPGCLPMPDIGEVGSFPGFAFKVLSNTPEYVIEIIT